MYSQEQAKELVKKNIGSLEKLCKEAICTADLNLMLAMGFPESASKKICEIIINEAKEIRISNLEDHYERSVNEGKSNIINTIVRRKHKVYFATRANLHPMLTLQHFESEKNDLCSIMFHRSLGKASEMKKKRREAVLEGNIKKLVQQSLWLQDEANDDDEPYNYYECNTTSNCGQYDSTVL